jgi:WD40 repeat protein
MTPQHTWAVLAFLLLSFACVFRVQGQQPEPVLRLPNKYPGTRGLSVSKDARYLAYCNDLRPVIVWDLTTNKQAAVLKSANRVEDVVFSPDSKTLVACHADNQKLPLIRVWAVDTWKELAGFGDSIVWILAFSSDGRQLFAAGGYNVTSWDVAKREALWQVKIQQIKNPENANLGISVDRLAVSPDDKWLAVATARKNVGDVLPPIAVMVLDLKNRPDRCPEGRHPPGAGHHRRPLTCGRWRLVR